MNTHKFHQPRRGATMLYTVLVMLALLGICSLAVDFGYVSLVKTELRSALDAASLAGAGGLATSPAEARARAKAAAASNKVNGAPLTIQDSDIQLGSWNANTRQFTQFAVANESKATAIRITAPLRTSRGTQVNLFFARLLGKDFVEMQTSAVGAFAAGMDVVIVQDVTTSFSDELADARAGDLAFLDSLYARGGTGGMGVVAFTGWGKTIAPLQKINANYTALTNAIKSLQLAGSTGMPKASGTDIAAGLEESLKVFGSYNNPSASGRAIVLVSDGEPNASSSGSHPKLSDSQLLTLAQQIANQAWAQKIHVYVVFYNESNSATAATKLKSLIRGDGAFVQVTVASDLPAAMETISKNMRLQLCD